MEAKRGENRRRETADTDAFTGAFHPHTAWFDTIQSKSLPVIRLSASLLTVRPRSGACVVFRLFFSFPPSAVLSSVSYYLSTQSTLPLTPWERTQKKNRTEHWRREHWAVPWAIPTDPNSANCLSGLRSMCVVISQCHVVFQIFPHVPDELSSAGYKTFQRALKSLKCLLF